jgi:hypothetical protein
MVHPQALVEPMGLPLRPNPQKNEKRTGRNFRTVTRCFLLRLRSTVDGQIQLGKNDNHISQNLQICIV